MLAYHPKRRAMAPLELALVLPILLSVAAAMLYVARAGVSRTAALSDARGEVWADRQEAASGPVLELDHPVTAGLVEKRSAVAIPVRFGPGPRTATGHAGTTFPTWSHEHLTFGELAKVILPHLDVLRELAGRNRGTLMRIIRLQNSVDSARLLNPNNRGIVRIAD